MDNLFIQMVNRVDPKAIRVEKEGDDEIIIVPSATLPDNVVMNGGLYPSEEISRSFQTLDGTPAPAGHPEDDEGNFVSARSEIGINNYHVGAFNSNVRREKGRVFLDKRINRRVAEKMNRGPELLKRLDAMIKGEEVEPIHTSTGVFLHSEDLSEPRTNERGEEYSWIARDMLFDHDAILLDERGAATPEQGVGMMVNDGRSLTVNRVLVSTTPTSYTTDRADGGLNTNEDSVMLKQKLLSWLKTNNVEVAEGATDAELAEALDGATIKANAGDGDMKKMMSEMMEPMMSKMMKPMISEMMKSYKGNSDSGAIATVQTQVSDLSSKVDSLLKANSDAEQAKKDGYISQIKANSEISEDELKGLSVNMLSEMASRYNPTPAYNFGNGSQPQAKSNSSLSNELPE